MVPGLMEWTHFHFEAIGARPDIRARTSEVVEEKYSERNHSTC
jgi:hypothetical protein